MTAKNNAIKELSTLDLRLDDIELALDVLTEAAGNARNAFAELEKLVDEIEETE